MYNWGWKKGTENQFFSSQYAGFSISEAAAGGDLEKLGGDYRESKGVF